MARHSVLRTKYLVVSTQYLVLSTLLLTSCSHPPSRSSDEPSFAEQLKAAISGHSDRINVSSQTISDAELAKSADANGLKTLIIDTADSQVSAHTLERISTLPNLETFWFRGRGIDDAGLAHLAKIKSLKILNIPHGKFTDAGLASLKDLPNLVQLRFGSRSVSDEGIATLTDFPALLRLHLIDVPITGDGLKALAKIEQLESLYIDGGNLTDADVDALFQARPKLHVHFNQQHHDRDPHHHDH